MSVRRTRASLTAATAVLALGVLLSACGDDSTSSEATATSLPEISTSTSADPGTDASSSAAETAPEQAGTTATDAPAEGAAPESAAPEAAPAPDQPAADAAPASDRGAAFVNGLRDRGIAVLDNGDLAVSTAEYICTAQTQGVDAEQINTYVTALAGSEASAAGVTLTEEEAAANAATYIEVANATYCS